MYNFRLKLLLVINLLSQVKLMITLVIKDHLLRKKVCHLIIGLKKEIMAV